MLLCGITCPFQICDSTSPPVLGEQTRAGLLTAPRQRYQRLRSDRRSRYAYIYGNGTLPGGGGYQGERLHKHCTVGSYAPRRSCSPEPLILLRSIGTSHTPGFVLDEGAELVERPPVISLAPGLRNRRQLENTLEVSRGDPLLRAFCSANDLLADGVVRVDRKLAFSAGDHPRRFKQS